VEDGKDAVLKERRKEMTEVEVSAEMREVAKRKMELEKELSTLEKRFQELKELKVRLFQRVVVVPEGESGKKRGGPTGLSQVQKDALRKLGLL
jgi:hypothetical protein